MSEGTTAERSRGALFLLVAIFAAAGLWFVLGSVGLTIIYRFVPPPVTITMLADPNQWARVVAQANNNATSVLHPTQPGFRCTLEVDGTVVKTNQGGRGALCSIRLW